MNHFVEDIQRDEPLEFRVFAEVDAASNNGAAEHLVGERQSYGSESKGLHRLADRVQALHIQSSHNVVEIT